MTSYTGQTLNRGNRLRILGMLQLITIAVLFSAHQVHSAERELQEDVDQAVQKGIALLFARQEADGTFKSKYSDGYPDGVASLCLLAVLRSGVSPEKFEIRRTLKYLEVFERDDRRQHQRDFSTKHPHQNTMGKAWSLSTCARNKYVRIHHNRRLLIRFSDR